MPAKNSTQEQAKAVADQLLKEGVRPTQQNVRERMGSGSITTINKALNSWWQELGERMKANSSHPMIPDPVAESAAKLWHQALGYAEHAFEERKQELEREFRRKLKAQGQESHETQQELKDLRGQCIQLLKDNDQISNEKRELHLKLAECESRLIGEQAAKEAMARELKQASLMSAGSQNLDDYIELQVTARTLREENKRLNKQIDILINDKSGLQQEVLRLQQENAVLKAQQS
ncbi:DNA-binding protein [Neptuniibacter halophilus]|uniref:DNA-binding protein n=1 Tax=Neptuniibacter halophilus TaxID=651666 RepID=UPI0025742D24|nr:DNA-binding protein [Neptuniibacter halophilus]